MFNGLKVKIMKKKVLFAAMALVALASCSDETFVGDVTSPLDNSPSETNAIVFASASKGITRADHVGADAANLLNGKFIVSGFKGAATQATSTVFNNYLVVWDDNSAGTTSSNTDDWEYVGKTSPVSTTGTQTIKYWDYSQTLYDFIAYSPGNNTVTVKTLATIDDDKPGTGVVYSTPINPETVSSQVNAYSIKGGETELTKCYIADRVTVAKANYGKVVSLTFRALAAKVRFGLYETVPGYSVKEVKFYAADGTPINSSADGYVAPSTTATLIGTFNTGGQYNVYYKNGDQKAYVTLTNDGYAPETKRTFSNLTYGANVEQKEADGNGKYLMRSANNPSFANGGEYTTVLPVENAATQPLELRVDYTLEAIDNNELIVVHGAKAFVPANYTQWLPNYAYTYIFKITDNTNGWTSTNESDPAGLFPITFDAVVTDSEELTQSTITTVSSPSITAYQNGRSLTADEFAAPTDIYIQVMEGSTLKNDLNSKSRLYTLSRLATEAEVLDALHTQETSGSATINGRNGLGLTTATITAGGFTSIPRADGNSMTIDNNTAAKFTPSASKNYVYVYDTGTWKGIPVTFAEAPDNWSDIYSNYYTNEACTTAATSEYSATTYYKKESYIYTARVLSTEPEAPEAWGSGIWFKDPDGKTPVGSFSAGTYYKRYVVDGKIYGVKVIKVE